MIYNIVINQPDDLTAFRIAARQLLAIAAVPSDVVWSDRHEASLFHDPLPAGNKITQVPRAFVDLAEQVACHRDEQRWHLLYETLWRIDQGERNLLERLSDPLIHRLRRMAIAVRHDQHRMTAFVRFREVDDADDPLFLAWYEPQHRILRRAAPFFIDRFANMRFAILTPDLTLHWDCSTQHFAPGMRREDAASSDAVEEWWQRYYAATFNPSRINPRLMRRHIPARFWRDMPETKLIPDLIANAGARTERMIQSPITGKK